jgi:NAD(P)-dependent dehydrogenase (short-subunit alcohol dehydrogenase family)
MGGTRVAGKSVVVTGGASGIGRATVLLYAQEGARHISIVDLNPSTAEVVAKEVRELGPGSRVIETDVTDPAAVTRAIADARSAADGIDVVISNAGWADQHDFVDLPLESWTKAIAINLSAHYYVGQAAARTMIEQGTGGVLLFTTSAAAYGGTLRMAPYNAAKAGLQNLVKTMALELAPHGIRVNSVSPGSTDTPTAEAQVGKEVMDEMRKAFPVPLGRLARPEEIGHGFLWLGSDDASYVTGLDLRVDAGMTQFAANIGQLTESPNQPD